MAMPSGKSTGGNSFSCNELVESLAETEKKMLYKVTYRGYNVRIMLPLSSRLEEIKHYIGWRFALEEGSFKLKYLNQNNDMTLLASSEDIGLIPTSVEPPCTPYIKLYVDDGVNEHVLLKWNFGPPPYPWRPA